MATTTASLQINTSWNQTDNTITDDGNYLFNRSWSASTGYSGVTQSWYETKTLAPNSVQEYSLTGLTRSVFAGTIIQPFSNVRAIYIENQSLGIGTTGVNSGLNITQDICVRATGANGFSGLFNGQSGNYAIPAKSPFILVNYIYGWPVISDKSKIFIHNTNTIESGIYKICIIGLI
jgi:hypothetical protein